jgi:hypothetical protein
VLPERYDVVAPLLPVLPERYGVVAPLLPVLPERCNAIPPLLAVLSSPEPSRDEHHADLTPIPDTPFFRRHDLEEAGAHVSAFRRDVSEARDVIPVSSKDAPDEEADAFETRDLLDTAGADVFEAAESTRRTAVDLRIAAATDHRPSLALA